MSISLQVLFGKGDLYFDLLEASAEEARVSVGALIKVLSQPTRAVQLSDFADPRRKDKRITEEIGEHLCKTFVTPLDREDIEALSATLYKVPKTAEKFAERFLAAPPQLREAEFA
ncbi:MAG: DUF47 domain-containing protein, partial [Limisphaerales bacterium]